MSAEYALVSESMSGRRLYRLDKPVPWREYLVLENKWVDRTTEFFVVSLGRLGDTAIFPAEADGSITEFDALHETDHWIVDYDAFIREWLEEGQSDE